MSSTALFEDGYKLDRSYDASLALIAYLAAALGSYTSLVLMEELRYTHSVAQAVFWRLMASVSLGGTAIFTLHFVAMTALQLEGSVPLRYDIWITVGSLVVAIIAIYVGFSIVGGFKGPVPPTPRRTVVAGLVCGAGIMAMHQMGGASIKGRVRLEYDPGFMVLASIIGVVASVASFIIVFFLRSTWARRVVASLVMGGAIAALHFTAIEGTYFYYQVVPDGEYDNIKDRTLSGELVGVTAAIIAGFFRFVMYAILQIVVGLEKESLMAQNSRLRGRLMQLDPNARKFLDALQDPNSISSKRQAAFEDFQSRDMRPHNLNLDSIRTIKNSLSKGTSSVGSGPSKDEVNSLPVIDSSASGTPEPTYIEDELAKSMSVEHA